MCPSVPFPGILGLPTEPGTGGNGTAYSTAYIRLAERVEIPGGKTSADGALKAKISQHGSRNENLLVNKVN